ncbi:MAG TPA: serine hydrolase domain-containing protein [Steroidobacteraceae bacterium]|jgi:CubicO group peptidase (beta-lactamase class C family)|nr:serine hydrolase domain-containing protein [Steroidobacteraceae bacterium]
MRATKFLLATVAAVFTMAATAEPAAKPASKPATAAPASAAAPALVTSSLVVEPAAIDAALKSMVDSQKIVGASGLVFQGGKEVYFGAFGMADRENNKPMARDTLVQIFSMTKPVVGVALMKLYERGKFQLDDPLEAYAPEFANLKVYAGVDDAGQPKYEAPKRKVTIRDILRHTAGLAAGRDDQTAVGAIYREIDPRAYTNTLPEVAQKLGQVPLAYQPGTRWLYSDAVDVQAYLVQKISGVPFDRFLDLHIFKPLGMTSTRYTILPTDPDRAQLAPVYTRNDDGTFTRQSDEEAWKFNSQSWPLKPGSFGLVSTIDDYMKFARMLLGGGKLGRARILKPETVKLMATDAMPREVTDKSWLPSKGQVGFGIDFAVRIAPPKDASESSGAVGEFFWDGAASTLFWVDPKNDLTAVLFTQMRPFDKVKLHKAFRDAVYRNDPVALAH